LGVTSLSIFLKKFNPFYKMVRVDIPAIKGEINSVIMKNVVKAKTSLAIIPTQSPNIQKMGRS